MDAIETRAVYEAALELRQEGREIAGRFPYRSLAVIASTGRVRKESFSGRAFSFAVQAPEREIHLLAGHSFDRPLARKGNGSLVLEDTDDALSFRAMLPPESEQPTYMRDALMQLRAGLIGGLSPGFQVPPASVVPDAESIIPEQGNAAVGIRLIRQALLLEMSLVTRPAYPETDLDLRASGLYAPHEPDPLLRLL